MARGNNSSDDDEEYKVKERPKPRNSKNQKKIFEDGYDEDFVGDEKDQEYLDGLNDLEREQIILERKENREKLIDQQNYRQMQQKHKEKEEKEKRLNDLQKRKQQATGKRKSSYSQSSDSRDSSRSRSSSGSRSRSSSRSYSNDSSYDDHKKHRSSNNRDRGLGKGKSSQTENQKEQERQKKVESLVKNIVFTRDQLENYYSRTNFADLVKNFYVRVKCASNIAGGHGYLFSKIKKVAKGDKEYELSNGTKTNLILLLQDGTQFRPFQIRYVSNQPFEQSEFIYWYTNGKDQLPDQKDIEETLKKFQEKKNFVHQERERKQREYKKKIISDLENNADLQRREITSYINVIENEIAQLESRLRKYQEQENPQVDEKQIQQSIDKNKQILKQLKDKRGQIVDQEINPTIRRKVFFQKAKGADLTQEKLKQKEQKRIRKIEQLNASYMEELELNKKFANFQSAEEVKQSFIQIHNRPLQLVDPIVDSWIINEDILQEYLK